ncbi:MAG: CSLREA domain-containing protein [Crocosphaera sp.]|nr:CSLREA domain-containing protein [Crocosphaera sp.]
MKTSSALVYCLVCLLSVSMDRASAQAEKIVVDTTEDNEDAGDGSCTLREAINNANLNIDTTNGDCLAGEGHSIIDVITFNIPLGQQTIIPNSALPIITEAVVIDGTTQSGFEYTKTHSLTCPNPTGIAPHEAKITIGRPVVELNGVSAGNVSGITINANGVVIRGLAINRFRRYGIELLNSSSRNVIKENYIGTDISGTKANGNSRGVVIAGGKGTNPNDNVIENNVISGNTFLGILVNGDERGDSRGNYVFDNLIGTDYTGKQLLGNTQGSRGHGVVIGQGNFKSFRERYFAENNQVRGNVIAGSYTTNLWLSNYASHNLVECNYIGTDLTGTVANGSCWDGLLIGGTRSNALARLNTVRYNLISGNAQCQGNTEANLTLQWGATDNTIEKNLIGTDITGERELSKIFSTDGIGLKQPANLIRHNVIGGHRRHGIHIYRGRGREPWNNQIESNYIGINPNGININNGGDGIAIFSDISSIFPPNKQKMMNIRIARTSITGNVIANNGHNGIRLEARGDEAGFKASLTNTHIGQNTIRHNQANGILLTSISTVTGAIPLLRNNTMTANSIFANGGLGIAFSANIPTSYDVFVDGEQGRKLPTPLPTSNEAPSTDLSSNRLPNYPLLLRATLKEKTEIQGTLLSIPNTTFVIEFFGNNNLDTSNFGEGEIPLGSISVTTNAIGKADFTSVFSFTNPGQWITATATDPRGNTSEFSRGIPVVTLD